MSKLGAAGALLALGLTGCMSGGDFAGRAVEHNRAIAMAADQIALLNIVRAAHDRPVVYSQFQGVSEDFSNEAGLSVNVPFGADAGNFYSSNLSVGPNQYVSLTTAPLDDVDFYQGVMRPIQVGLLRYYLDNGWPRDLVLSLAVEKLDISDAFYARVVRESDAACAAGLGGLACQRIADPARQGTLPPVYKGRRVFINDPRSSELFDAFHNLTLRLIVLDLTIDGSYAPRTLRVPTIEMLKLDADTISKLQDKSTKIERDGSGYLITTYAWVPGLKLAGLGDSTVRVEGESSTTAAVDMTASLRSPDSILFYLGAYIRDDGVDATVLIGAPGRERFVPVILVEGCNNAVISVDLEGACYGIPADGDHVSMKVVAFIHQVFGLNKRAVEPPAPAVVRTVN